MIKKLFGSWIIQLFCIFWAVYLFLDYLYHSDYFVQAFTYFEYSDLIFTIIILTAGITYLLSNRKKSGSVIEIKNFRGIYHYLFTLFISALIILFYINKTAVIPNAGSGTMIYIFKTIGFHLGLGIILLSALSTGFFVTELLPFTFEKGSSVLISLVIGIFVITMLIFLLGALGLLYQFVVIPLVLILIIPGAKKSFAFLKTLINKSEPFKLHFLAILAYVFLLLLISINLISATRPIAIGYDGLGLYMNTPKLIAGYHGLVSGGYAYNWSLMMSLGFIMYNNAAIAILISIVPGIFSLFAIYRICVNMKISSNWAIYACALFYSLPNTIWQSKNEEKTDLALLFITLCSLLLFTGINMNKSVTKETGRIKKYLRSLSPEIILWAICGCLIGFTFGIKYVAMLSIFALLTILFYNNAGKYGAITMFFLNFAVIFGLNLTKFAAFENDHMLLRMIVPLALALIALFFTFKNNREGLFNAAKKAMVFCIAIGITYLPWAIKNVSENKSITLNSILEGKSSLPELNAQEKKVTGLNRSEEIENLFANADVLSRKQYSGFLLAAFSQEPGRRVIRDSTKNRISEFSKIDRAKMANKNSSVTVVHNEKEEEIRRYLGYESGIVRFISLPYDLAMKTNVKLISADTGILLLILIPVFMFIFTLKQLPWNILKIFLMILVLIASVFSVELVSGPVNQDAAIKAIQSSAVWDSGFFGAFMPVYLFIKLLLMPNDWFMSIYNILTTQSLGVSFVFVVLISIPIYFLFRNIATGLDNYSKAIVVFIFCVIQYWLVLSSGIVWYGIAGFSLIPVLIALMAGKGNMDSGFIRKYIVGCSIAWFLLILPFQFMPNKFLYTTDKTTIDCKEFVDRQFVKYGLGEYSEKDVIKKFFTQGQQNIINVLNNDKKANILNVSTFFNYYIVNNDKRVYGDNQLGIFKDMYSRANNDKTLLAGEFRKDKIKYVLVSLKAAEIDKTEDKSLTRKFDELMRAMVNNPEFKLVSTNRIVERPDGDMYVPVDGVNVVAKYDIVGKRVLDPGTDALFEIL